MKTQQSNKSKKPWIVAAVSVAVIAFIIWLAYFVIPYSLLAGLTNYYMPNYAKDTAMPIEKALIRSGAKKVCEHASNGRDIGNTQPYYNTYYQFNVSKEDTAGVLQRITKENGYTLKSTPSEDNSVLNFEDRSSKDSTFSDLPSGKVELVASIDSDTANKQFCGDKDLKGDSTHSVLSLGVSLPSFRE